MRFSDVFGSEIACIGQYMKTHTVFKLLVVADVGLGIGLMCGWRAIESGAPAF